LYIGNNAGNNESFWIDCNNWLCGFGYGLHKESYVSESINPLGAGYAACLGVAELFRIANSQPKNAFCKWYSLIDFSFHQSPNDLANDLPFPEQFNPGQILQVGSGAVGSNFLFFLALTNWQCNLTLVDFDAISLENCSTSLVFNEDHEKEKKVTVCDQTFPSLHITTFDGDYRDYKASTDVKQPDILLCFANERNIWKDIQYNLPPLAFHATTTRNWGVNFGRHIPLREWCLVCRFEGDLDTKKELNLGCSEGLVQNAITGEETIGMLPFLSAASALLVLVEMAKLASESYPINRNFLQFSFKSREGLFLLLPNKKKPCFVCGQQTSDLYNQIRETTKYWYLSVETAAE